MKLNHNQWKYGGALILTATSLLIISSGVMNPLVPMPLYLVILAWVALYIFPIVIPAIYLFVLMVSSKSQYFSKVVLGLISIISSLNVMYFIYAWNYGLKYQGDVHTIVVALENIIGFGLAMIIAIVAHVKKSKAGTYLANFIMFLLLSWCAFPYLGELP